jgi:phage tail-like protein
MNGEEPKPKEAKRNDPYGAFNFLVQIGDITVGGFSEVSGLKIETEVYTIKEGGMNYFEYKLPKSTKFSDITFKKGITNWELYNWYLDVIYGNIVRKNGSIVLHDQEKNEVLRWDFYEAYPIKWEGSTFSSSGNSVATETLVLTHHGLF